MRMSHGNSGVRLMLLKLIELGEGSIDDYIVIEEKLRLHGKRFYLEDTDNWMDTRTLGINAGLIEGRSNGMVSWAVGVALERHEAEKILKMASRDKENAMKKIENSKWLKRNCLCHGNAGKLLVRDVIGEVSQGSERRKIAQTVLEQEEMYTMGLMTGISGVGYGLLVGKIPYLPNVLTCGLQIKQKK